MAYSQPTLAQAQAALASRLNDPDMVHWVAAELTLYLQEALRTWNCWTQHWRAQASFQTTMLTAFYELPTVLPAERAQTVTNWDLVEAVQYALLEPAAPGGTWTGTDQFTLAQVSEAIQRRRDQFIRDTGCVLTHSEVAYVSPTGRLTLDESFIAVRRAAWTPAATQLLQVLYRTDEWAANAFAPTWPASTDPPAYYSTSVTPPLTLQLIPPTTLDGTLDLVSLNRGPAIDPVTESELAIPNDYAWGIKYGALADLLGNDGLALDPVREAYCEQRYQQCVTAAKRGAVVLAGRINGSPCTINALADADSYSPTWQLIPSIPTQLVLAGQNLIGTWPRAGGGGPYTILLDVVQNAPIPLISSDILQIGQDVYDAILDLAQHAALFKDGGGALQLAMPLLERAMAAAGVETNLQQAAQPSRRPLLRQTQQDRQAVAEQLPAVTVE